MLVYVSYFGEEIFLLIAIVMQGFLSVYTKRPQSRKPSFEV